MVGDTMGHVWETKSPGNWFSIQKLLLRGAAGQMSVDMSSLHCVKQWREADLCQDSEVPIVQYRLSASPGIGANGVGLSYYYFKYNFFSL